MAAMPTTMTSKGQVTIPKRVRDRLGLKPGSQVEFDLNSDGYVIIRPANDDHPPPNPFAQFKGILKTGLTTDEMMEITRGRDDSDGL